jgi:hypothetical protein
MRADALEQAREVRGFSAGSGPREKNRTASITFYATLGRAKRWIITRSMLRLRPYQGIRLSARAPWRRNPMKKMIRKQSSMLI